MALLSLKRLAGSVILLATSFAKSYWHRLSEQESGNVTLVLCVPGVASNSSSPSALEPVLGLQDPYKHLKNIRSSRLGGDC